MNNEESTVNEKKQALRDVVSSKEKNDVMRYTEEKLIGKLLELNQEEVPSQDKAKLEINKLYESNSVHNKLHRYIINDVHEQFKKSNVVNVDINKYDVIFKKDKKYKDIYAQAGGIKHLRELEENANFSFAGFDQVSDELIEQNERAGLIDQAIELIDSITENQSLDEIDDQFGEISQMISKIQTKDNDSMVSIQEALQEWHSAFYGIKTKVSPDLGLTTGYENLDDKLNGLRGGQFFVIAARPGMGKTAFVLNLMNNIAKHDQESDRKQATNVLMFSLEMNRIELIERFISMNTAIDGKTIRRGYLTDLQWTDISVMINQDWKQRDNSIFIDDTAGITMSQIEQKVQKVKDEYGKVGMVVVDYLQLISSNNANRQQAVADISRRLKILAKKFNIPVIALSQLNRSAEVREDHKPVLSDLRESGQIEQDADVVMMISRSDYYEDDDEAKEKTAASKACVEIVKNRSGEQGDNFFVFHKNLSTFVETEPDEEPEMITDDDSDNDSKPKIADEDDPFSISDSDLGDFEDLFGGPKD